jgi:hypothetical protein
MQHSCLNHPQQEIEKKKISHP